MNPDRRALHIHLSHRAHEGLRLFALASGVSVSALLEAMGRNLPDADRAGPQLRSWVTEARAIDAERRQR